ncbi:sulfotransferase family protein [Teredinibacter waterburyi]|jgi:Sulfotransferase domain.|uniref:sulfotransferase family protein n=1 Tax=Teredinibacter waterburyi TaxID=1500538 RepID=UPI00165F9467|nr:sulfotransferase domain-containing protein [Teredinibacter waterburyi]
MNKITPPNFLYIGPDKSGSTWLYKVLSSHPQCFVPDAKDIYFFDNYYERGFNWYLNFFKSAPTTAAAIGEISHGYLFNADTPARIRKDLPTTKVLTTLRNPVERSISHYFYLRASGLITCSLQDAVSIRPGIINSSLYFEPIARYLSAFPQELINISFFEELSSNPQQHAFSIFNFLEIEQLQCTDFAEKVREARQPKNVALAKLMKLAALKARDMGFASALGKIKNSKMINTFYKPLDAKAKNSITDSDRDWLLTHFRDDILRLQDLLQRDLQHWLKEKA